MSTVAERVARGAALLDEKRIGWWEFTNLDRLDMGSDCGCVLGQEFGLFSNGARKLLPAADNFVGYSWADAQAYGFADEGQAGVTYWALSAEWRRLIEARRERAV